MNGLSYTLALALLCGCDAAPATPGRDTVALTIATRALGGSASYRVIVSNGRGEVLSSDLVSGAVAAPIAWQVACDASAPETRVSVALERLVDPAAMPAGDSILNPAPPEDPLVQDVTCTPGAAVPLRFDVVVIDRAVASEAAWVLHDAGARFLDQWCAAGFEPVDAYLKRTDGTRGPTGILRFVCTDAASGTTTLLMDRPVITCASGARVVLDVAGPSSETVRADDLLLYGTELYRGTDAGPSVYWNTAFGVNVDALANEGACSLSARATTTDSADGTIPASVRWPVVSWQIPLTDADGALVWERGGFDTSSDAQVTRGYAEAGHTFDASYVGATDTVTVNPEPR